MCVSFCVCVSECVCVCVCVFRMSVTLQAMDTRCLAPCLLIRCLPARMPAVYASLTLQASGG